LLDAPTISPSGSRAATPGDLRPDCAPISSPSTVTRSTDHRPRTRQPRRQQWVYRGDPNSLATTGN